MTIAAVLLRAHRVGIRDLKEHLSTKFLDEILVITDRGEPVSVNLPYEDLLDLTDILDELSDPKTIEAVMAGKKVISAGVKGIPVSRLFRKIRKERE